ncbi:MAG: outer membrane protein assembly factor BamA [Xanthobacteraceae bacterium]
MSAVVLSVLVSGFLTIATCGAARAEGAVDSLVTVVGNRHTDAAMIRSYFHLAPNGRLDAATIDAALKSLYATGLFSDVKITRDADHVVVLVAENPTVQQIAFEGNKKVKDDELKKAVQSKAGGPLSRFLVQADVERLVTLYRQHGYFQAQIVPETINIKNSGADAKQAPAKHDHDRADAKSGGANANGERANLVFQIKEGDKLAVRKIAFAGNNAFAANKLSGVIKTGKTNFLSFLLNNDIYDSDKIENDCELLHRFYLAHGYADVRVSSNASYDESVNGVVLTFTLEEGPPYRFGKVEIESHMTTVDPAPLRAYLLTHPGDTYDADAVSKTVDDLTMDLAKSGQPFASVFARAERVPPSNASTSAGNGASIVPVALGGGGEVGTINLVYTIDEGKRVYVERVEIHGNTKTHGDVIRREFDIGEGDAYNRALVDRAERRLKALGYFKTVTITSQPGSAPDRVVLSVTVQEQDTGNFAISGGYSTTAGILAEVSISDKNLFGTGFIGKASVTYGQYARGFELGLTDPYFLNQRLSGGVELFANQTMANVNQSFDSTTYGAKLSLGMPLTEQLGVTWNYSIYNQSVSLNPAEGTSSLPIQQAAAAGPIWVSSIGPTVTYSTLDNAKDPTSGIRVQTSNELAGLGGAAKFAKTTEDVRYYHPIVGDIVGMVRTQDGYVTPYGGQQLPLLDGFFGGPQLIRGFAPNGFGPRDITPGTTMDNIGGNIYWTTSAELEAPVPGVPADANLKIALFSDTGSLWATGASSASSLASLSPSQQIANSQALRSSIGTALIWNSPFGPMQVNYAYPIAKQPYDVTQRLSFTAGGF